MVDGPPDDGQLRMLEAGPKDLYKKRYNVAVSRARNQLMDCSLSRYEQTSQERRFARRLLAHAHDPDALLREMEVEGNRTDSPFEKADHAEVNRCRLPSSLAMVGRAYRIDLVVEGLNKRLAVECDGEKWHTPDHSRMISNAKQSLSDLDGSSFGFAAVFSSAIPTQRWRRFSRNSPISKSKR